MLRIWKGWGVNYEGPIREDGSEPEELGETHCGNLLVLVLGSWGGVHDDMLNGALLAGVVQVSNGVGGLFGGQVAMGFLLCRAHREMGREGEWVGGGELN